MTSAPTLADLREQLADVERRLQPARRSALALQRQAPTVAAASQGAVIRLERDRDWLLREIAGLESAAA